MKRLASFTIIELVVAMLISSIAVTIVYYTYSLMKSQLEKRMQASGRSAEYVLFERALRRDFERAARIEDSAGGKFILLRIDGDRIRYLIDTVNMVRSRGEISDTFSLKGNVDGIRYLSDSLPLVTALRVNTLFGQESLPLFLQKDYTARELLQAANDPHE
jgi:type II secretory pathway pseudopilin PulG